MMMKKKLRCYLRSKLLPRWQLGVGGPSRKFLDKGWQIYGVQWPLPKPDEFISRFQSTYKPSFCYAMASGAVVFNQGRNTGTCSHKYSCLCINHCTEVYLGQKKTPGSRQIDGVYVEETLHAVNGYNVWVNTAQDRFMYKCPDGNTWAVWGLSHHFEQTVRDSGKGCWGYLHCSNCGGATPYDAHWGKTGFEVTPLCGNRQFDLLRAAGMLAAVQQNGYALEWRRRRATSNSNDATSNSNAGTYEIDLTPAHARDGVPIWQNKAKSKIAYYCEFSDKWYITDTYWLKSILYASGKNKACSGYLSTSANKNLNPKHLNWGDGWYQKMQ
jgi:hypothetical protein